MIKEKCGVVGIYSKDKEQHVSRSIFGCLLALQHRGQESGGIYTCCENEIRGKKEMGLVSEVFREGVTGLFGNKGIGHVRYSTAGLSTIENAMPYYFDSPFIRFALSYNGTLTNHNELRKEYREKGHDLRLSTDTEVLALVIAKNVLENNKDYIKGIKESMKILEGAYSVVLLDDKGEVYGFKDPIGFKPLCIGKAKDLSIIASESVGIDVLKGKLIKNLEPGEIVKIEDDGSFSHFKGPKCKRQGFCMFEFVYFARPDSILKNNSNESVENVREKLGINLAKTHPVKADVIVPIPDSGRSAASGYHRESGIEYNEALIKNRYIHRTFIMPTQKARDYSVYLKLNVIKEYVKDKDVILVDDSIVRGTTCRQIVKLVKDAGAKKVHLRISCPPLIAPCYMGVDFPRKKELIASKKSIEEIKKSLKVDSLGYQTLDGLVDAIGLKKNQLCLACLNNEYPTKLEDIVRWLFKFFYIK